MYYVKFLTLLKFLKFLMSVNYSKVCYATGLTGADNLVSGNQAAVECAMKAQGARLATFINQAELDAFSNAAGYSSDTYWMGRLLK